MKLSEALNGVSRVFLDTAPVIYFLERNPNYYSALEEFFRLRRERNITIITSPITLAECLVYPLQLGLEALVRGYERLITEGEGVEFYLLGSAEASLASQYRATYGIHLLDAFQVATALLSECQVLFTNDRRLAKITDIHVLILEELQV